MAWCARIRFVLSPRVRVESAESQLVLETGDREVELRSAAGKPLRDASDLVLWAQPYESEAEATAAAHRWRGLLQKAFARVNLPADFGDRAPKSFWTRAGLEMLEASTQGRILNDVHGIAVFECEPKPRFAGGPSLRGIVGVQVERLIAALNVSIKLGALPTDREQLAYDLYSASFSEPSADARLAMLMMAVETLIELEPRSMEAQALVDRLIKETRVSGLPEAETESIVGSLNWLHNESIGQAGRKLASRLGERRYMEETPTQFFTNSYSLRSRLIHGQYPRPTMADVNHRVGHLELFVRDLLSVELIDKVPD